MKKLPENIKAVLFDFDGTLVDSMGMWGQIDIDFLGKYGLTVPPDLKYASQGRSFKQLAVYFKDRFELPITVDEIMDEWNHMAMEEYTCRVPLKSGVPEFLSYLKNRGIIMGIVSSNSYELLASCLTERKLMNYFSVIVDGKEIEKGKPEPFCYLHAAEKLKLLPEECLVFEDLPQGITAGKSAGMTVWAVADGYSEIFREEKAGLADDFIETYFDISMEA